MKDDESIGVLETDDQLYGFLRGEILGQVLGYRRGEPVFDVYRLDRNSGPGTVFRYTDRNTAVSLVCKFYGNKCLNNVHSRESERAALMRREYSNLSHLRRFGFDSLPHRVVEPLAVNPDINCVLVESFVYGRDLGSYIRNARSGAGESELEIRLTQVTHFLADLHSRICKPDDFDEQVPIDLLHTTISELRHHGSICDSRFDRLCAVAEAWQATGILQANAPVLLYGDVKPDHFLFGHDGGTTGIDLETLACGDAASDLGRLVAQLKHTFGTLTDDLSAAEPYIQHVYRSYSDALGVNVEDFSNLTLRGQFYMGCYLANFGLDRRLTENYRQRIIHDTENCLVAEAIGKPA